MARCWTFSKDPWSVMKVGPQAIFAYSNIGQTSVVYSLRNIFILMLKDLFNNASIRLTLA